jgi:hypothetical protein
MTEYSPNRWVIVKVTGDDPHYRVLGAWQGGYLGGDSWRMNSGITRVDDADDCWFFYGSSGSVYRCHKENYGLTGMTAGVIEQYGSRVSLMDERMDWHKMDWIIT